jgi:hypothetical protein
VTLETVLATTAAFVVLGVCWTLLVFRLWR